MRSVPLIDHAARALDALSRRELFTGDDDLVFVDDVGGHLSDWRLGDRFHVPPVEGKLEPHPSGFTYLRHTFGTLAVQVWPLTDAKAYMGHADISTRTMIYVHDVPPRRTRPTGSSRLVAAAESVPRLRPVSGHARDTIADPDEGTRGRK